jgi:hypothetical protein
VFPSSDSLGRSHAISVLDPFRHLLPGSIAHRVPLGLTTATFVTVAIASLSVRGASLQKTDRQGGGVVYMGIA